MKRQASLALDRFAWVFCYFHALNIIHMLTRANQFLLFLQKREQLSFFIWVLLHALPIIVIPFFMSYDGPAHLYNSRLLAEWLGPNRLWFEGFLFLQQEPLPNWITYLLLAGFGEITNYFIADKLLQVIYVFSTLYGFRYLVRSFQPKASLLTWLGSILVFHSMTGMYNFSMSLPLLMWTSGFYYRQSGIFRPRALGILFLLSLALYFAHITGYLVTGLFCGFILLEQQGVAWRQGTFKLGAALRAFALTLLFFLPTLGMAGYFIAKRSDATTHAFSTELLLEKLFRMDALILFNVGKESFILKFVFLFIALGLLHFWEHRKAFRLKIQALWLVIIVMLTLYFVVPDASMGASYTSVRLQLFFIFFAFVLFASRQLSPTKELLAWLVSLIISMAQLEYYARAWKGLSKDVAIWEQAGRVLPNQSRVLTLNYSGHWYHEHISNFLALDTPAVMMYENYEASNDYFPFRFQPHTLEVYRTLRPLLAWPPAPPTAASLQMCRDQVDVIVRWRYDHNNPTQRDSLIDELLFVDFYPYYSSGPNGLELFMNKKRLYEH